MCAVNADHIQAELLQKKGNKIVSHTDRYGVHKLNRCSVGEFGAYFFRVLLKKTKAFPK